MGYVGGPWWAVFLAANLWLWQIAGKFAYPTLTGDRRTARGVFTVRGQLRPPRSGSRPRGARRGALRDAFCDAALQHCGWRRGWWAQRTRVRGGRSWGRSLPRARSGADGCSAVVGNAHSPAHSRVCHPAQRPGSTGSFQPLVLLWDLHVLNALEGWQVRSGASVRAWGRRHSARSKRWPRWRHWHTRTPTGPSPTSIQMLTEPLDRTGSRPSAAAADDPRRQRRPHSAQERPSCW